MNAVFSKVAKAGLIVGTLDISSAFIYYFIRTGKNDFVSILKYIASGIFGQAAFSGGSMMILSGLILHYIIAFAFTIFFFLIFPQVKLFSKNKMLTGIIYGIFIWMVMNLVVVPLSSIAHRQFNLVNAIINVIILIVCIGVPLSFMADKFFKHKNE